MLVIRLQRTGRKNQPSYRIVVAEKSKPVKGRHIEVVGSYNPSEQKKVTFDKARIEHWVSVGARPSDTVAGLLTYNGVSGLDAFMAPRTKKRAKKNPSEEELAAMEAAKAPAAPAAEAAAPVEEEAAAPAEEAAAEEPTA